MELKHKAYNEKPVSPLDIIKEAIERFSEIEKGLKLIKETHDTGCENVYALVFVTNMLDAMITDAHELAEYFEEKKCAIGKKHNRRSGFMRARSQR